MATFPMTTEILDNDVIGDDWHSVHTIRFGELVRDGFDWGANEWQDFGIPGLRERLNAKIEARYQMREIGITPPGLFRTALINALNEKVFELKPLYELADVLNDTPLLYQGSSESIKERTVLSDYPQAQLDNSNDYASQAQDHEKLTQQDISYVDAYTKYQDMLSKAGELDQQVLKYIGKCFSALLSSGI